jgi:hypothetical protein
MRLLLNRVRPGSLFSVHQNTNKLGTPPPPPPPPPLRMHHPRPSPGPVWAIEDMCGSLHVLDPARRFTLGRSQKCNIRVQPSFGYANAFLSCALVFDSVHTGKTVQHGMCDNMAATRRSVSAVHACIHALSPNKWELQDRSTVGTLVHSTLLLGRCRTARECESARMRAAMSR